MTFGARAGAIALLAFSTNLPTAAAQAAAPAAPAPADASQASAPAGPAPAADASADTSAGVSIGGKSDFDDAIGIDVALGIGWAMPAGEFVEGARYRDTADGHMPLRVDLGYRIMPSLAVGVYGIYAPMYLAGKSGFTCDDRTQEAAAGMMTSATEKEVDCSATVLRAGLQVSYHFDPGELVDPWAGLGIGFERATIEEPDTGRKLTVEGMEIVNISAGFDIELFSRITLGPFLQVAIGKYSSLTYECGDVAVCTPIDDQAVERSGSHQWYTGGLRLARVF